MANIYSEIRQTRPFKRRETELVAVLLRTSDNLYHSLQARLKPFAISPEQYNVLRILAGAGEKGHPTLAVARRMLSRSPNITRLVDKLIAKGLARRDRDTRDRRMAVISITPKGSSELKRFTRAIVPVEDQLGALSPVEVRTLVDLLDAVRDALGASGARKERGVGKRG